MVYAVLLHVALAVSWWPVSPPPAYTAGIVRQLADHAPGIGPLTIVAYGHSVPAGYGKAPRVHTFDAYPHLLHRMLAEDNPTAVVNVVTSAIGGENSERGWARFERDALGPNPTVLLIDYGLNDRIIGVDRARTALTRMVAAAKERGIIVLLLTPTADTGAHLTDPADPLNQQAEMIRALARAQGVGLVDSLAAFRRAGIDGLMATENHPNRSGHEVVAIELMRWFRSSYVRDIATRQIPSDLQ